MVIDPASKMETENIDASYESRYEGKTYHFCCS
jgi:YHS domain-containing protein